MDPSDFAELDAAKASRRHARTERVRLDPFAGASDPAIAQVTEYAIAVIGMEGSVPDMVWDGIGRPDEDDVVAYLLPSGEDTTYFPSGR